MKDFKEFVELEEGLKPEHNMRPGWMIKADPVLKAKIDANKKKQKEMKALLGQKIKEEAEQIDELSSDTLQKYKTAAHKSIGNAAVKRHAGEMGSSEYRKNQDKRSKGINRADADKRLGTYKDKTPKKLDISGSANDIQKKYHSGSGGSRMSEETSLNEDAYKEAETYKSGADAAKKRGDTGSYHAHMANHHDAMAEWNSSKGRESTADRHMKKSEEHHDAFLNHKNIKEDAELNEVRSTYGPITPRLKAASSKAFNAGVKHGKAGAEKDKTHMSSALLRTTYLNGYKQGSSMKEEAEQIDELSNDTLASYKKKAGESASAADKKGDMETGNKRFKGIMKATFKQFDNDAKK